MKKQLLNIIGGLDLTQVFKGKGDAKRWSAKRTIGGTIVAYALYHMEQTGEIEVYSLILCFLGILPLCLSFLEKD